MGEWLWILGGLYVLVLVYATYISWRSTSDADDYMLAGSSIGVVLGFLTFSATLFSTFTLLGMPDFFRTHGVGAWIFLAVSDGAMAFLMIWFGFHLRRRVARQGFKGMAGLMSACYGNRWGGFLYFAGVFLFLVPYVAVQIRGIGIFLHAAFPEALPVWGWAVVIMVVMLIYSEIGGLKAIIYSDALQGLLLLGVTWLVAAACVRNLGGVPSMFEQVRADQAALLSTPGPQGLFTLQFLIASFFAVLLLPVTQPQLSTRIVIMRDTRGMQRMAVAVGVFALLVILPTVGIGLYGAVHHAGAPTSRFLVDVLIFEQPGIIGAAVTVGLIAAAMSTADSQIFALGSELRSLLSGDERSVLLRTKLALVAFAAGATGFAILAGDQLVLMARVSFAGTALLAPLILAGLFARQAPGVEVIVATAAALALFLASLAGLVPEHVVGVRLDLGLLLLLGAFTAASTGYRQRRPAGLGEAAAAGQPVAEREGA